MNRNDLPVTVELDSPEDVEPLPDYYKVAEYYGQYYAVRPLTQEEMALVFDAHTQRVLW